jgi:hypothetical protein
MPDLRPCEFCEKPIAPNALRCPHCGGIPKRRTALQVWAAVVGVLTAIILASFLAVQSGHRPAHGPAVKEPPRAPAAKLAP